MHLALRAILAVLGSLPAGLAAADESAPKPAEVAAAAIRDLGLQTDLPRIPTPPGWSLQLSDSIAWILIALGVVFLVYLLRDYIPLLRGRGPGEWGDATGPDGEISDSARRHLAIAEALAAEGRFVEAMHELLLDALGEIRARAGERLADSLTSREILRAASLPDPGRSALREIIGRVEWTYFGEHPGLEADYLVCRENFDRLHGALAAT